jgi:hypothetical protein
MANLFPEGYADAVITEEDRTSGAPVGYRNGVAFDYETGDFKRDGKNMLLDSYGIESWKSWCIICIQTERYAHLACPSDFGIETAAAMRATSRAEAESILSREITEALLADPYGRTKYVEDISYDWTEPDMVIVSATVHGIEDVSIDLTAYLTKGGS